MRLENYLIKEIKNNLYSLLNSYIQDADNSNNLDEVCDLENQILSLDDMTLEQLINKNLEYFHKHELEDIVKTYIEHYFEIYVG